VTHLFDYFIFKWVNFCYRICVCVCWPQLSLMFILNQTKHWSFCFTRFYYHLGCKLIHDLGCSLLRQNASKFLIEDLYRNPGPLQFDGPGADAKAVTLCVEDQDYMGRIKKLQEYLDKVLTIL
jgi:hypothetical protein